MQMAPPCPESLPLGVNCTSIWRPTQPSAGDGFTCTQFYLISFWMIILLRIKVSIEFANYTATQAERGGRPGCDLLNAVHGRGAEDDRLHTWHQGEHHQHVCQEAWRGVRRQGVFACFSQQMSPLFIIT